MHIRGLQTGIARDVHGAVRCAAVPKPSVQETAAHNLVLPHIPTDIH